MHEYTNYIIPRSHTKAKQSEQIANKILNKHLEAIGFNNRSKNKQIIKILPLGKNLQAIQKVEKKLIQEIKDLDYALNKINNHMKYVQGFLFAETIDKQLLLSFQNVLKNKIDCVENGFHLWRLRPKNGSQEQYELVSSRILESPKNFKDRLMERSIANLQRYENDKNEQSIRQINKRWDFSIKVPNKDQSRLYRFKTQSSPINHYHLQTQHKSKGTDLKQSYQFTQNFKHKRKLTITNKLPPIYDLNLGNNRNDISKKSLWRGYQNQSNTKQLDNCPSIQQLLRMIKKQNNIISIWLPPSNYPQILGLISIQIRQKQYQIQQCHIKKYFFYKHGVSRRLFNSILEWISGNYPKIEYLSMIVSKLQYSTLFSVWGWRLFSWVNEQKIKIIYKRGEQKQF